MFIGVGCSIAAFIMIYVCPKCICAIFTLSLVGIIICGLFICVFIYFLIKGASTVGANRSTVID